MTTKLYDNLTVVTDADLSSAPGAASKVLQTTAAGLLTLQDLDIANALRVALGIYLGNNAETAPTGGATIERGSDTAATAPIILFRRTRGTPTSKTSVQSGDLLADLQARGNYSGYYYLAARIHATAGGVWDGSNKPGQLVLGTTPSGGGACADRAYLTPAGCLRLDQGLYVGSLVTADAATGEGLFTSRVNVGTGHAISADGTTRLRTHTASGGLIHWTASGIDGTAKTVIANGAGDVAAAAFVIAAVQPSAGAASTCHGSVAPGGTLTLWSDGASTLTLAIAADGSVTVQRTAGTITFTLSLFMVLL